MKFTIYLNPITKKNSARIIPKKSGGYLLLPSKAYMEYEKEAKKYMPKEKIRNKRVNVKAIYYRATRHRVDLCNLHECLCDVLVKHGVLEDDNVNIIATMDGSKVLYDKDNPRTEVDITEIKNEN